ncbi:MAG TPA: FAD-dependent monooxygenase [Ktedonobacteraceae bacterium]|nr:FAD-dependent monooxygenase [Ktedonobacteraceae bacterium]
MVRHTPPSPLVGRHALVIGGSMAGLLAGRVLTDHFDQVTIIDRDRFPQEPTFRKGVPQARHPHVLLRRGQIILEQLFPGLEAELAASGALLVDWGQDTSWLTFLGRMPRFPSGLTTYACSRNLLEWLIRRRLTASASVQVLQACEVIGLVGKCSNSGVGGVRLRFREGGSIQECQADLVVDASGRQSHAPEWLEALGYARPQETIVNTHVGYASRHYQLPPDFAPDWKIMLVQSKQPEGSRAAIISTVEGNRWIVTLIGGAGDDPSTDEDGFLAFAQSLPNAVVSDALKDAQPLSPIYGYRYTENRLRHYERLSQWPEGFVALGDAVCSFNPGSSQGMTIAAMGALTLETCLREQRRRNPDGDLTGLPERFQKALAEVNKVPWLMATGGGSRSSQTKDGKPNPAVHALQRYRDALRMLAVNDPQTHLKLLQVMHLLKPTSTFLQPILVMRVLRQMMIQRKAAVSAHKE